MLGGREPVRRGEHTCDGCTQGLQELGNAKTDYKQDENDPPLLPAAGPAPIDTLLESAQAQGVAFLAKYVERQEKLEQISQGRNGQDRKGVQLTSRGRESWEQEGGDTVQQDKPPGNGQ